MSGRKPGKRETQLAGEIREMMGLARDAQNRGSYSAAVSARSKVSALRTELARLREERAAEAETDPLARIQRLRRLATEAGSYTAAGHLAKQETELLRAREIASQAASDGLEDATDEEILGMVQGAILALPDTLVQTILQTCQDRLQGRKLRVV